jgi:hypothetical protein
MDQMSFIQKTQRIQQLLRKDTNECRAQTSELILLDEFVKVDTEQLECQAKMLPVDKGVFESQEMVVVVLVILAVELLEGRSCQWGATASGIKDAYQVQH